jgi:hypothetical protein
VPSSPNGEEACCVIATYGTSPSAIWNNNVAVCCKSDKVCGDVCCSDAQECLDEINGICCNEGQVLCEGVCQNKAVCNENTCQKISEDGCSCETTCKEGEVCDGAGGCCNDATCPSGQECHPKTGQCVDTWCVQIYKEVYNAYKYISEYDMSTLKQVPTLWNNGCCFDDDGRMWSDEECGLYNIAYMIYSNNEKQFIQITQHVCQSKPCSISDYGDW